MGPGPVVGRQLALYINCKQWIWEWRDSERWSEQNVSTGLWTVRSSSQSKSQAKLGTRGSESETGQRTNQESGINRQAGSSYQEIRVQDRTKGKPRVRCQETSRVRRQSLVFLMCRDSKIGRQSVLLLRQVTVLAS